MRLLSIAVVVAALVASLGYTFLRERPGQAASARDGAAAIVPESVGGERGGEPAESFATGPHPARRAACASRAFAQTR